MAQWCVERAVDLGLGVDWSGLQRGEDHSSCVAVELAATQQGSPRTARASSSGGCNDDAAPMLDRCSTFCTLAFAHTDSVPVARYSPSSDHRYYAHTRPASTTALHGMATYSPHP